MGQLTDQQINNPNMNPTRHTVKALLTDITLDPGILAYAKKGAALLW